MNWKCDLKSVLITWLILEAIGLVRFGFAPVASVFNLMILVVASFAFFLPLFLFLRRIVPSRTNPLPYILVGAASGLLIMILWRCMSGISVSAWNRVIESIGGIMIGSVLGFGFGKAQTGSEQSVPQI